MQTQPLLVSIIIPTYRRANFLRESLRILLLEQYEQVEIIVVDDGSPTDIKAELASEFSESPVRFFRQPNAGLAAARNFGASQASGSYLLFIDDDDLLIPENLHWLVQMLNHDPEAVAVAGRCRILRDPSVDECQPAYTVDSFCHWDFLTGNRFYTPGQVLIRRSAFDASGGFDPKFKGCEDWEMWVRLSILGPFIVDNRFVLHYRKHNGNMSNQVALMCTIARLVIAEASKALCAEHIVIGRYLGYDFVRGCYTEQLLAARRSALRTGDWVAYFAVSKEIIKKSYATNSARFLLKLTLIRDHKRTGMPFAKLSAIGRHCPKCAHRLLNVDTQ